MEQYLFEYFDFPSSTSSNQQNENAQMKHEFHSLSLDLDPFTQTELRWLLVFLDLFLSRMKLICDKSALYFLKNEGGNGDEDTICFFLDQLQTEISKITYIFHSWPLENLVQAYRIWLNSENPEKKAY